MISRFIEPGTEDVVTISIEREKRQKRGNRAEDCSFGAGI